MNAMFVKNLSLTNQIFEPMFKLIQIPSHMFVSDVTKHLPSSPTCTSTKNHPACGWDHRKVSKYVENHLQVQLRHRLPRPHIIPLAQMKIRRPRLRPLYLPYQYLLPFLLKWPNRLFLGNNFYWL